MKINISRRSGFTLIELSIVLIIIGLIISSILSGQELIKSAEARGIITQMDKYTTAVNAFKLKYNSLPGDFLYATTLLPTVTSVTTVNGDGNGVLYSATGGAASKWDVETFLFWQHLGLLGVVEAAFLGTLYPTIGTNIPSLKNNRGGLIAYTSAVDGNNYYHLGILNSTTAVTTGANITGVNFPFAPDTAYTLDNKVDDGAPGTGNVVAVTAFDTVTTTFVPLSSVCASSATAYNISNSPGFVCMLKYRML